MSMMISFLVVNCIARIVISIAVVETVAVDSRNYFSKKAEVPSEASVGQYPIADSGALVRAVRACDRRTLAPVASQHHLMTIPVSSLSLHK